MNQFITISAKDTLNILKAYIEINYGYANSTIKHRYIKGYSDCREYEPDRVEFHIVTNKDLGLGIGVSQIELILNQKEAAAIIQNQLLESKMEISGVSFILSSEEFEGTKVTIKSLFTGENKSPKILERYHRTQLERKENKNEK